jgi:conjugative transfer region protein (TIGR03750 family)
MKERASCRYLTHKYPAFLGCTLEEVLAIVSVYLILDVISSCVAALFLGMFFLDLVVAFLLSIFLIRFTCRKVGQFKENQQAGFLMLRIKHSLHQIAGFPVPFITRTGVWSKRRTAR